MNVQINMVATNHGEAKMRPTQLRYEVRTTLRNHRYCLGRFRLGVEILTPQTAAVLYAIDVHRLQFADTFRKGSISPYLKELVNCLCIL